MKQIPLSQGLFALVDDEDFEELSKYKWCAYKGGGTYYAIRNVYKPKKTTVKMHRSILRITDYRLRVDHKNGNGLDNRKENIRIATFSQNGMNRKIAKRNRTGFKGVHPAGKKFVSAITVNMKSIYIGTFDCPIEAAKAYNAKAIELHGEFARLNEIPYF